MKTWQIVLVVGAAVIVGALVLMRSAKPKATTQNTGFATGNTAINGLAAGVGGFLGSLAAKPASPTVVVNEGTYQTGFVPVQQGNVLKDPNTGKELVYGTD